VSTIKGWWVFVVGVAQQNRGWKEATKNHKKMPKGLIGG